MNRVDFGVFSLSASSPTGDDARYLQWHLLDHLPQQYSVPGVLFGQRWVSTPECRAARAFQAERFEAVNHVVQYLFGAPVAETVDEFFVLRDHLIEIGRFPERLPGVLVAGCALAAAHAAPSALVTSDVVPYRPNRGAYLIMERAEARGAGVAWSPERVEALLAIEGVAGMWMFTPGTLRPDEFSRAGFSVAVCYLDEDPVAVAGPIGHVLADRWRDDPVTPGLAAPFVTVHPWDWQRHRRPG